MKPLALFAVFGLCLGLVGCRSGLDGGLFGTQPSPGARILYGVNLDWDAETPTGYSLKLGHRAAVYVAFLRFPMSADDGAYLDRLVASVAAEHGMVMLTLEPVGGLDLVTPEIARLLAEKLSACNAAGVPFVVRFAHEMNGSWYPWGQKPTAWIRAFRLLAEEIHRTAHSTGMIWAPNYGGGYPFAGGPYACSPGDPDFQLLDTNGDGVLTMADDPYLPYYPGDDAADWVGMSLYHWGTTYPWGRNEVPEDGKFLAQLTGTYSGLGGDHTAVPDFYQVYGVSRGKPVAIPETAALYNTQVAGGADELLIKQAWWRQVFDRTMLAAHPQIRMINWFEHIKVESEIGAVIDWRVLGTGAIAAAFRADLPTRLLVFGGKS